MYWTYLRRELGGRKKQTIIVAAGLAIAIALVIVVNALSAGVKDAQTQALQSVYGVGTDLTVTGAAQQPGSGAGGGQQFDFGGNDGTSSGGTTSIAQSRLMTDFRRGTLASTVLATVEKVDGVSSASAALSLTNTSFSGQLPDRSQMQQGQPGCRVRRQRRQPVEQVVGVLDRLVVQRAQDVAHPHPGACRRAAGQDAGGDDETMGH